MSLDLPTAAAWLPIAQAKPSRTLMLLGNPAGVYASDAMPDKWVRGFIREDGTAWDYEGYPLRPTHFLAVPEIPVPGATPAPTPAPADGTGATEDVCLQLIEQRDTAQEALSDLFSMVTGRPPEWSNLFGYSEALDECEEALSGLELARELAQSLDETWLFVVITASAQAAQRHMPMHRAHAETLARVHRALTNAHAAGLLPTLTTVRLPALLAEHGYDLDSLLPTPRQEDKAHG